MPSAPQDFHDDAEDEPQPPDEDGWAYEDEPTERSPKAAPLPEGALFRMMKEMEQPDPNKPAWVLTSDGTTQGRRVRGEWQQSGLKLKLQQWEYLSGTWRKTKGEKPRFITSLEQLKMADWIGRLPKMGRYCPSFSPEVLAVVIPLFEEGLSDRKVATKSKELLGRKLGRGTVAALRKGWQAGNPVEEQRERPPARKRPAPRKVEYEIIY
jgi:hypothetical protein